MREGHSAVGGITSFLLLRGSSVINGINGAETCQRCKSAPAYGDKANIKLAGGAPTAASPGSTRVSAAGHRDNGASTPWHMAVRAFPEHRASPSSSCWPGHVVPESPFVGPVDRLFPVPALSDPPAAQSWMPRGPFARFLLSHFLVCPMPLGPLDCGSRMTRRASSPVSYRASPMPLRYLRYPSATGHTDGYICPPSPHHHSRSFRIPLGSYKPNTQLRPTSDSPSPSYTRQLGGILVLSTSRSKHPTPFLTPPPLLLRPSWPAQ